MVVRETISVDNDWRGIRMLAEREWMLPVHLLCDPEKIIGRVPLTADYRKPKHLFVVRLDERHVAYGKQFWMHEAMHVTDDEDDRVADLVMECAACDLRDDVVDSMRMKIKLL